MKQYIFTYLLLFIYINSSTFTAPDSICFLTSKIFNLARGEKEVILFFLFA